MSQQRYWVACVHCHDFFQDLEEAKAHEPDCHEDADIAGCVYRVEVLT